MGWFKKKRPERMEYENIGVKDSLVEMKDLSEQIIDLSYSAILFDSSDIASQVDELEETGVAQPDPLPDMTDDILMAADEDIARLDWSAVDKALSERSGLPIRITR